jgi:hypothetical protein
MFLLLAILAGWFALDGWVRWPGQNTEAAQKAFPKNSKEVPVVNPAVTEEAVRAAEVEPGRAVSLADLRKEWGEPAYLGSVAADGSAADQVAFFVGPLGYARVKVDGQKARSIEWHAGPRAASDLLVQKLLASLLGVAALIPLLLVVREISRQYELNDEGLVMPGHGRIPYDRMIGIDASSFASKGIVRLKYLDAAGGERTAVLDEERIEKFDEIVTALCRLKGWPVETAAAEGGDADKL